LYDRLVTVGEVLPLPTPESAAHVRQAITAAGDWFYRFAFSNGVETAPPDPTTQSVHDTRANLIFPLLDRLIGPTWAQMECVDLACHQGWFAAQLAARGAKSVLGLDLRSEHIHKADLVRRLMGADNLSFRQQDLFDVSQAEVGAFDVALFLGVLYHLDNPVGALRIARAACRSVCVIETQVARSSGPLDCLWGSGAARSGPGIAVVRSDDVHVGGGHDIVLVPTLEALLDMIHAAGFRSLAVSVADPDDFVQFVDLDRVVVFAFV
jgi:tRNA (mo5U34)-methyltransferase